MASRLPNTPEFRLFSNPSIGEASPTGESSTPAVMASRLPNTPEFRLFSNPSIGEASPTGESSTPAVMASRLPNTPEFRLFSNPSIGEASPPSEFDATSMTSDSSTKVKFIWRSTANLHRSISCYWAWPGEQVLRSRI